MHCNACGANTCMRSGIAQCTKKLGLVHVRVGQGQIRSILCCLQMSVTLYGIVGVGRAAVAELNENVSATGEWLFAAAAQQQGVTSFAIQLVCVSNTSHIRSRIIYQICSSLESKARHAANAIAGGFIVNFCPDPKYECLF